MPISSRIVAAPTDAGSRRLSGDSYRSSSAGITFRPLALTEVPWAQLDATGDRVVSQTREWIDFLVATQRGKPVVAALEKGGETCGWFTGVVVRKFGLKLLGSPLRGWTTPYMGFNLRSGVSRKEALDALPVLARKLRCHHLEIVDRYVTPSDVRGLDYGRTTFRTFITDLRKDEEQLFGAMSSSCRRAFRKSEKEGVSVEVADPEGFAEEYYEQLLDVFAKQGLKPTYGLPRVQALIQALHPTGRLLLLRARDPYGRSIATGIFPGFGPFSYFWGNASFRSHQRLRPNEALHWHAMLWWKERGAKWHDWGGGGRYKRKYGVEELSVPRLYQSRPRVLQVMRIAAEGGYKRIRRVSGSVRGNGRRR